jgi:predicted metal-dependent HD superfamily phosphohydrolase
MLALLQQQTLDEAHKHLLELAIWYHDSIYDAASKNNEAQSAKLAQAHWKQHLPTPQLESLKKLIQATAKHQLLDYTVAEQLFLDLDLSILAAPPAVYRAYSQAIAQEYQAVYPRLLYKMGRKKVLKNFLARPRIYFSNPFYESYEAAARANLAAEQKELA